LLAGRQVKLLNGDAKGEFGAARTGVRLLPAEQHEAGI
jgi:hypothetical protein